MNVASGSEITLLLKQIRDTPEAFEQLIPLVYDDLKRIGHRQRKRLNAASGPTLQTTALVHEAFFRLREDAGRTVESRCHFRRLAAQVMRQLILDHARRQRALKRGGPWIRDDVPLEQISAPGEEDFVLALETAMRRLEAADPRQAEIAATTLYAGYTAPEVADMLSLSERTVARELKKARAFLTVELGRDF